MGRMVDSDRVEIFAQKLVLMVLNEYRNCQKISTVLHLANQHQFDRVPCIGKFYMNTDFYKFALRFALRRFLQQSDLTLMLDFLATYKGFCDFDEFFDLVTKKLLESYLSVERNRGFIVYCLIVSRIAVIAHRLGNEHSLSLAVTAIVDAIKKLGTREEDVLQV